MDEEKYKVKIGTDKMLVYHPDPSREPDNEFIRQFQEAGSSNPATLQDFFIRLAEIQKRSVHQKIPAMQIELKNVKIAEHLSEETTAFTADLYVNSRKIAFVKNEGQGGSTHYQLYKKEDTPILRQAEEYCKSLPPAIYDDTPTKGQTLTLPMDLENFIDAMLNVHLMEKFKKKMEKHQEDSILYGIAGTQYYRLKFLKPIAEILKLPNGIEVLRKNIQEKILPKLKEGESILNTNLPPELMQLERKRPRKESPQIDDSPDKRQGRKI